MTRLSLGRTTMTIVQVAGVALSFRLDWSQNHLLNPLWHPHAKFHGALLLFMLAKPAVGHRIAALAAWITAIFSFNTVYASTQSSDAICTVLFLFDKYFMLYELCSFNWR